ncbi:MAG: type I-E CRISPR-associated protein Cse1/CasA [Deltaproteobacteria bacterium]|nr:type I-E CRISPR-associated protein Cse1/CasA [Deltaproteobacteria bacterium]
MAQARAFNLVDEAWIPIAGQGLASLNDVFSREDISALGGNPIQKIALFKLFLAIAQAAHTPEDDADWAGLYPEGLNAHCLAYLAKWHDSFWLYGEKPFLQMSAMARAKKQSYGALLPHIATGNTTVLFDLQRQRTMSDAERALLTVVLMGFGFGGKKTDNSVVLTPGYIGKRKRDGERDGGTGKPGANLGFLGYQHHFLSGSSLLESIWLNLLTAEDLLGLAVFTEGVGSPPWERMPEGEDCATARSLKNSLMGRLAPLSKFILLAEDGIHYSDGILYADHKSGGFDPSTALDLSGKDAKALWTDPGKHIWRELPALLGFLAGRQGMKCFALERGITRGRERCPQFGLWAGGIRVSSNAGEQYASGSDDFAESAVRLTSQDVSEPWFVALEGELLELDALSRILFATVKGYGRAQKVNDSAQAKAASAMFWQLCGARAQALVNACGNGTYRELRPVFADFVHRAYNSVCPRDTARQLEAWAANRPNTAKYLKP